jgi:hypothetical protein
MTGCATGPTPQNANDFRVGIKKGGFGTQTDSYTAQISHSAASKKLISQTKRCLHQAYNQTTCMSGAYGGGCSNMTITYKPTIYKGKNITTLQVQRGMEPDNAIYIGGKPPKGGMIISVIDIKPKTAKSVTVDVYGSSFEMFQRIPNAVKLWLSGTNSGCPNLEK